MLNKIHITDQLHHKYLRAAARTKSKPRRRKLLSRAKKYREKNLRQWSSPKTIEEFVKWVAHPISKGILASNILKDIFEITPLGSGDIIWGPEL
jgi:hypothetical protein